MNAPSNPTNWFVDGSTLASFTYYPGPFPFYVAMRSKGHIAMSILLWATDEIGVRLILRDIVNFGRAAINSYEPNNEDLKERYSYRKMQLGYLSSCLHGLPCEYELTVTPFVPNHPVKVGWANNDTIL